MKPQQIADALNPLYEMVMELKKDKSVYAHKAHKAYDKALDNLFELAGYPVEKEGGSE